MSAYELANFLSETAAEIQKLLAALNTIDDFLVMWTFHDAEIQETVHSNTRVWILRRIKIRFRSLKVDKLTILNAFSLCAIISHFILK